MPSVPLPNVPLGTRIFIDANVLIYAKTPVMQESAACAEFLSRCSRQEIIGISMWSVLADVLHRVMIFEAKEKGLATERNPAKTLKEHPDRILQLTERERVMSDLLDLNLLYLELDEEMMRLSYEESVKAQLLTNDALVAACMRKYGISHLASNDPDFLRVNGITVFSPSVQ